MAYHQWVGLWLPGCQNNTNKDGGSWVTLKSNLTRRFLGELGLRLRPTWPDQVVDSLWVRPLCTWTWASVPKSQTWDWVLKTCQHPCQFPIEPGFIPWMLFEKHSLSDTTLYRLRQRIQANLQPCISFEQTQPDYKARKYKSAYSGIRTKYINEIQFVYNSHLVLAQFPKGSFPPSISGKEKHGRIEQEERKGVEAGWACRRRMRVTFFWVIPDIPELFLCVFFPTMMWW